MAKTRPLLGCEYIFPPSDLKVDPSSWSKETGKAFKLARKLGFRTALVEQTWSKVETGETGLKWPSREEFSTLHFLEDAGMKPQFRINSPVNHQKKWGIPPDLSEAPFDAVNLQERFTSYVREFVERYGSHDLLYLAIGNQPNLYLSARPDELPAFKDLLRRLRLAIQREHPNVLFGTTFQMRGLFEETSALMRDIAEDLDWVGFRQYVQGRVPFMTEGFRPGKGFVDELLERARGLAGEKGVILTVTMPTSPAAGGSEDLQAEFVTELIDAFRALSWPYLILNWGQLFDRTEDEVRLVGDLLYNDFGGLAGLRVFQRYLATGGLFRLDGTPKKAVAALRSAL
jgi:hypothetical protein